MSVNFQLLSLSQIRGAGVASARRFSSSTCPFRILGLKSRRVSQSRPITYEQVRAAFRAKALEHHPDTNSNCEGSNIIKSSSAKEFSIIRAAYEAIVEGPGGIAMLRDEHSSWEKRNSSNNSDNEMDAPNYDSTNGFTSHDIEPQILREVAEVAKKMNPGGLDRGGMWQYANMIREKADRDDLPPLHVGPGHTPQGERLVRRRRRK